ncbi:MAG: hypothetical protein QOH43_549 [Solirubrobacteraceae bacterium]|nr:hypothetical protein [Solirubrobacteraceae bacterium]
MPSTRANPSGIHQLQRPNSATSAGTSSVRMTNASSRIPNASPVAMIRTGRSGFVVSEKDETARIIAAEVTSRPLRDSDPTTAFAARTIASGCIDGTSPAR